MSCSDFARSILIILPYKKQQKYLERIKNNEEIMKGWVSYEEFVSFQYLLEDLELIEDYIDNYRHIDAKKFMDLVRIFEKEYNQKNPK